MSATNPEQPAATAIVYTIENTPIVRKAELWRHCGGQRRFSRFIRDLNISDLVFKEMYHQHRRNWAVPVPIATQFLIRIHGQGCQFTFEPEPKP